MVRKAIFKTPIERPGNRGMEFNGESGLKDGEHENSDQEKAGIFKTRNEKGRNV